MVIFSAAMLLAQVSAPPVTAHGGGLNSEGCHNDRKNGGYHCHQGSSTGSSIKRVSGGGGAGTYFANCSAARAAGAAPVRSGDPGYSPRLDRDGDSVGCE